MAKVPGQIGNDFCPQSLFLYGNWKENGTPNFGLFCWFSYAHVSDGKEEGLGVMACIGEEKLTKDLIRKSGVFSANLVSERLLPLADYYGTTSGRETPDKMKLLPTVEQGRVLDVPTIAESPVSFELKVLQEHHLAEGSDLFVCKICNVMIEEGLRDQSIPLAERLLLAAPVITPGEQEYVALRGGSLGKWGEPRKKLQEG